MVEFGSEGMLRDYLERMCFNTRPSPKTEVVSSCFQLRSSPLGHVVYPCEEDDAAVSPASHEARRFKGGAQTLRQTGVKTPAADELSFPDRGYVNGSLLHLAQAFNA